MEESRPIAEPESSGSGWLRLARFGQPAKRPAIANPPRTASLISVVHPCTCAVRRRPLTWIAANAGIRAVATIRSLRTRSIRGPGNDESRYLAAPNADAAVGAAKPIRNETQPDRNAGNGP